MYVYSLDILHPELSGCITTLTVRNTGGCKLLCSNGHLDRPRWISPWFQQTAQFTPLVLELSFIRSHLLWGAHFLQLMWFHNSPIFFIPPGTHHAWVDRGSLGWEVLPNTSTHELTSVIWGNWLIYHVLPFVSDRALACINRCCTVIQRQWLVPLDTTRQWHPIDALSKAVRRKQRSSAVGVKCLDHSTTTADNISQQQAHNNSSNSNSFQNTILFCCHI